MLSQSITSRNGETSKLINILPVNSHIKPIFVSNSQSLTSQLIPQWRHHRQPCLQLARYNHSIPGLGPTTTIHNPVIWEHRFPFDATQSDLSVQAGVDDNSLSVTQQPFEWPSIRFSSPPYLRSARSQTLRERRRTKTQEFYEVAEG